MAKQALPIVDATACCSPLAHEPVSEAEAATLAHLFKALADPVRLRLLSLIGAHAGGREPGAGVCVCDLTDTFEVTAPTISYHLKLLRESGLVASERRGTWVYYWILPEAMKRLADLLVPRPVTTPADAGSVPADAR